MSPTRLQNMRFLFVAAAVLLVAGCAGDLNPVRDVFVATGIGDAPQERPEFIEEARPQRLDYVPVGSAPPPRETAPKTVEEIAEMEEELRRIQAANAARAAQARGLALSPPPEPVTVEPITQLGPAPEPVPDPR
jgi:hypothetical protein